MKGVLRHKVWAWLIMVSLAGCAGQAKITDGNSAMEAQRYALAVSLLQEEFAKTNDAVDKADIAFKAGKAYSKMNQTGQAVQWYQKAMDTYATSDYQMALAKALQRDEQYDEALRAWKAYEEQTGDRYTSNLYLPKLKTLVKQVDSLPQYIEVKNMESLNSSGLDYGLTIHDNQGIYVSNQGATGQETSLYANTTPSDLQSVSLKPFKKDNTLPDGWNTSANEGIGCFSRDGKQFFFTRCGISSEEETPCRIYASKQRSGNWSQPKELRLFADSIQVGHPALSPSGDTLFFASDKPGGFGGNDIYFSTWQDTAWGYPVNAGSVINSVGDEMYPVFNEAGRLYFSSDGKPGYGGLDVFSVDVDLRSDFTHLDFPINSGADDFYYVMTKPFTADADNGVLEEAYFSSSRKEGRGGDDIYRYRRLFYNEVVVELYVLTPNYQDSTDAESPVDGLLPIPNAQVSEKSQKVNTDEQGMALFTAEADKTYSFFVEKEGFFNRSTTVSTTGVSDPEKTRIVVRDTVVLERIFPEKEIVIDNIYYDYDKATLREESLPVLDTLVSFFQENSDLVIEIGSHTDSRGSDAYNENLSQARAQSVVDYLVTEGGVPKEQLRAKGYGESRLVNACSNGVECSEEEHQKNRRTTFRVIFGGGEVLESD